MKNLIVRCLCLSVLLFFAACSKESKKKDCASCTINANATQTATYEYCQNGNDVIMTSGNITKTFPNTTVGKLAEDDRFQLGAKCK